MMKKMGALLAAGVIAASLVPPLGAQENQQGPAPAPPPVMLKSESTAVLLSVAGGLVPLGLAVLTFGSSDYESTGFGYLILAAVAIGPSWGYGYAGLSGRALGGIGVRLIGLAGMIGGLFLAYDGEGDSSALGLPLALGGCVAFLVSTFYDMGHVRKAVRVRNSKIQKASLNIAPVLAPRSRTIGLSVRLGF